jgi:CheY-like chemotaxis protein
MRALHKVLVVDDDAVVGKSFDRVLSHAKGYLVITAQNGAEALERMREQEFDVVFTDIKMPGMDGIELAEQVKAKRPWTPVVIITGYGTTENEVRAKAVGVAEFVRKPLSPEMIEESAMHALRQPALAVVAPLAPSVAEQAHAEPVATEGKLRNVALFLAAPFIGLVYALFLPLVGLAMLAWMGGKAVLKTTAARVALTYLRNVSLFLAAPLLGLAYAVFLPLVGIGMLLWTAGQAMMAKPVAVKSE